MTARRSFLKSSVAALLAALTPGIAFPDKLMPPKLNTPWRNWSGAMGSNPKTRLAPDSEDALIEQIKSSIGTIRPVGAGHSFSALVPTDDNLLVLDQMRGLISHNAETNQAELWAGTRLGDAGPLLHAVDQAMINLPDIDRQTLGGALATSTHGTGKNLQSLSGYVTALRLIDPSGKVHDIDAQNDPDLFNAARVSFGSLGVISRARFQNRKPFRLRSQIWVEKTEEALERFDQAAEDYQHFELMPFLLSDYSMVIAHSETTDPLTTRPEEDNSSVLETLDATPVMLRGALLDLLAGQLESSSWVGQSYDALTNVRVDRFNEMEYSVPADVGPQCLREILAVVDKNSIDAVIPLEYRLIGGDDTWLSMFSGGPRVSISVHRMARHDYKPLFEEVEPIFWKYDGRPHWGKLHTLGYQQLKALYPRYDDFVELQKSLDPKGKMLNSHLRHLLGSG